jgi:hypothetical protein
MSLRACLNLFKGHTKHFLLLPYISMAEEEEEISAGSSGQPVQQVRIEIFEQNRYISRTDPPYLEHKHKSD